jgi:hypothetical protein
MLYLISGLVGQLEFYLLYGHFERKVNNMSLFKNELGKGIASLAVCALGVLSMWLSHGHTGVGWAILGILIIWSC